MKRPYKAAFVIPAHSQKTLSDTGWEFITDERVPPAVLSTLQARFRLTPKESYLGIDVYQGAGIEVVAIRDDASLIESILVKLIARTIEELNQVLGDTGPAEIEVFVPTK